MDTEAFFEGLAEHWGMLGHALALFALPFAHEDVAIVWGGYLLREDGASPAFVAGLLYAGMLVSDLALYGIGAAAARFGWFESLARNERVRAVEPRMRRNLLGLLILCRIVPGLTAPAYIACGFFRMDLRRFGATTALVAAAYLALVLTTAVIVGDTLSEIFGPWGWLGALAVAVGLATLRRCFVWPASTPPGGAAEGAPTHAGMPRLGAIAGRVAAAERIPPLLFYLPLALNWLRLSLKYRSLTLPTAVNPTIRTGGMWGESKASYFAQLRRRDRRWIADYVVVQRGERTALRATVRAAIGRLGERGIGFPVVAKPDIGWQGFGVRVVDRPAELASYLRSFPVGARVILQELVPFDGEAAILYAREPGGARGSVLSLTLRYYPHVVGDGCSTVEELMRRCPRTRWKLATYLGSDRFHHGLSRDDLARRPARGEVVRLAFIGSARAGGLYRDASVGVTPALAGRIDAIARAIPHFHYGRFDVRFASYEALLEGRDFKIFEANGIGGEAIEIWDPERTIGAAYRTLFAQQELLFRYGHRNRLSGHRPETMRRFARALIEQARLIAQYPPSG